MAHCSCCCWLPHRAIHRARNNALGDARRYISRRRLLKKRKRSSRKRICTKFLAPNVVATYLTVDSKNCYQSCQLFMWRRYKPRHHGLLLKLAISAQIHPFTTARFTRLLLEAQLILCLPRWKALSHQKNGYWLASRWSCRRIYNLMLLIIIINCDFFKKNKVTRRDQLLYDFFLTKYYFNKKS